MNKTQKNWKKVWKDYEPTDYDQIYRIPRKKRQMPKKRSKVLTAILVVLLFLGGTYVRNWNDGMFEESSLSTVQKRNVDAIIQANKNGVLMNLNIPRILEIFEEVQEKNGKVSEDTITEYIESINKMDLSEEYAKVKEQSVKKLKIAKKLYSTEERTKKEVKEIVKEYNDIDIISYIAEAFDQAGVEYSVDEKNTLHYVYYK